MNVPHDPRPTPDEGATPDPAGTDATEIIRSEERLDVRTGLRPTRRMRFRKRVVSEEVTQTVTIRREELVVEDDGPGIAPEVRDRLFERFASTAGVGLGLYIARGLVEAHQGRLTVDSAPGVGSRFHIWLAHLQP